MIGDTAGSVTLRTALLRPGRPTPRQAVGDGAEGTTWQVLPGADAVTGWGIGWAAEGPTGREGALLASAALLPARQRLLGLEAEYGTFTLVRGDGGTVWDSSTFAEGWIRPETGPHPLFPMDPDGATGEVMTAVVHYDTQEPDLTGRTWVVNGVFYDHMPSAALVAAWDSLPLASVSAGYPLALPSPPSVYGTPGPVVWALSAEVPAPAVLAREDLASSVRAPALAGGWGWRTEAEVRVNRSVLAGVVSPERGFVMVGENTAGRADAPGQPFVWTGLEITEETWVPSGCNRPFVGCQAHRWHGNLWAAGGDGSEGGSAWLDSLSVPRRCRDSSGDPTVVPGDGGAWAWAPVPVEERHPEWVVALSDGFLAGGRQRQRRHVFGVEPGPPWRVGDDSQGTTCEALWRSEDGLAWTPVWTGGTPPPDQTASPTLRRAPYGHTWVMPAGWTVAWLARYGEPEEDNHPATIHLQRGQYTAAMPAQEAFVTLRPDHHSTVYWDHDPIPRNDRMAAMPYSEGAVITVVCNDYPGAAEGTLIRYFRVARDFWAELEPWWWINDTVAGARTLVPPDPRMDTRVVPAGAVVRHVRLWRDTVTDRVHWTTAWYRVTTAFVPDPLGEPAEAVGKVVSLADITHAACRPSAAADEADLLAGTATTWPPVPWFVVETPDGRRLTAPLAGSYDPGFLPVGAWVRWLALDSEGTPDLAWYEVQTPVTPPLTSPPGPRLADVHGFAQCLPEAPLRGLDMEQYLARGWVTAMAEAEATADVPFLVTHTAGAEGPNGGPTATRPPVVLGDGGLAVMVWTHTRTTYWLYSGNQGRTWTQYPTRWAAPPAHWYAAAIHELADPGFRATADGGLLANSVLKGYIAVAEDQWEVRYRSELCRVDPATNQWQRLWLREGRHHVVPARVLPWRVRPLAEQSE